MCTCTISIILWLMQDFFLGSTFLGNEHRLRVFENRVPRRISRPMEKEMRQEEIT
jgi:hypothetical protein